MYICPHPGQRFSGQRVLARNTVAGDHVHHRLRRTGPAAQNDLLFGRMPTVPSVDTRWSARRRGLEQRVAPLGEPAIHPIATRRARRIGTRVAKCALPPQGTFQPGPRTSYCAPRLGCRDAGRASGQRYRVTVLPTAGFSLTLEGPPRSRPLDRPAGVAPHME